MVSEGKDFEKAALRQIAQKENLAQKVQDHVELGQGIVHGNGNQHATAYLVQTAEYIDKHDVVPRGCDFLILRGGVLAVQAWNAVIIFLALLTFPSRYVKDNGVHAEASGSG